MYEIIIIPGTRLRKTSACFIQWRDIDIGRCTSIFFCVSYILVSFCIEGGWGLNFMVEADAMKFLEGCSVRLEPSLVNCIVLALSLSSPPL